MAEQNPLPALILLLKDSLASILEVVEFDDSIECIYCNAPTMHHLETCIVSRLGAMLDSLVASPRRRSDR